MFFRKSALSPPAGFDPEHERSALAEMLLKRSAQLILGRTELEIIHGACHAIVETTLHIRLAWTWFGPSDTKTIRPHVSAGPALAYAQTLCIERNRLTQIGPAFSSLDGKKPKAFGISQRSLYAPWREAASHHGIRHVLALPIASTFAGHSGIFVLYANRDGYFDDVGIGLFAALAELFGSLMTVVVERQELEQAAYHDALTGLFNRHALELMDRRVFRTSLLEPASCVLLLDLDHFKRINDRFGHDMGDQTLQAVARVLKATLRRGDEVIRWGGEEFLVCLPRTSLDDAALVAEKLRTAVQEGITETETITVSIGACEIAPLQHLAQAVGRADQALLQAKSAGRNQVCVLS